MRKFTVFAAALFAAATPAVAAPGDVRITGQGTIEDGRTFNVSAVLRQDGTVRGQATLINRNFSGTSGRGPYTLHIDISCVNQTEEGQVFIGGMTRRTNDAGLVDAVFFAVEDNGRDDYLSRAFFWDGDPNTTGDPQACELNNAGDFPMEEVIRGNIRVRN